MRLAGDLTTNDRLLGQELGAQAAKSQQGEETSQIWDISLGLSLPYCNIICLTNPTCIETDSLQCTNLC